MPAAGAKIFVFLLVLYVFSSLKALSLKRICAGNHAKFLGLPAQIFCLKKQKTLKMTLKNRILTGGPPPPILAGENSSRPDRQIFMDCNFLKAYGSHYLRCGLSIVFYELSWMS